MWLRRRHLDRIDDRPTRLLFKVFGPAVPELGMIEHRIENRWSVASATLPTMANGRRLRVGAAEPEVVAGIAADGVTSGQARIEVQHLPEFNLPRRDRVAGQLWRTRRDRLELLPCPCQQIVLRQDGAYKEAAQG